MYAQVSLEIARDAKLLATYGTAVRSLSRVDLYVAQQVRAGTKRLLAVLARIVTLTSVDAAMNHQRVLAREALATILAHVRLDIAVPRSAVILEIAPRAESIIAMLTLVGLHTGICKEKREVLDLTGQYLGTIISSNRWDTISSPSKGTGTFFTHVYVRAP